jgi:hypothetical protein
MLSFSPAGEPTLIEDDLLIAGLAQGNVASGIPSPTPSSTSEVEAAGVRLFPAAPCRASDRWGRVGSFRPASVRCQDANASMKAAMKLPRYPGSIAVRSRKPIGSLMPRLPRNRRAPKAVSVFKCNRL